MKEYKGFVFCDCVEHGISVEKTQFDLEDGEERKTIYTSIQLWQAQDMPNSRSLRKRIKNAIDALKGNLYMDAIMIENREDIEKIIELLKSEPDNYKEVKE